MSAPTHGWHWFSMIENINRSTSGFIIFVPMKCQHCSMPLMANLPVRSGICPVCGKLNVAPSRPPS